jgi:hypothetical protein
VITGLRVSRGRQLDVTHEYIQRLEHQLESHRRLGQNDDFAGPLFTCDQLKGRVEYVCWINRRRSKELRRRFALIDWHGVHTHATQRGILVSRKLLRPMPCSA